MKKTIIMVLAALLALSPAAFAANKDNVAGGAIELSGLTLNTSPGVNARYITVGTTTNEQWFGIATYHGGGEKMYASSSNQTSIFKADRNTTHTFSSLPEGVVLPDTADNTASTSWWSDNGWER